MNIYDQMNGDIARSLHNESFYDRSIFGSGISPFTNNPKYLMNAFVSPQRRKLNEAKEFLKDHPCNPGVLDRWLKEKKAETHELHQEAK